MRERKCCRSSSRVMSYSFLPLPLNAVSSQQQVVRKSASVQGSETDVPDAYGACQENCVDSFRSISNVST